MCGIIGYSGHKQVEEVLLEGLRKLEYRGYDSVGLVCRDDASRIDGEPFHVCKEVGKVNDLERLYKKNPVQGHAGIGHCRWATHGAVTWNNAHPHSSSDGKVVLVHNGIIENYLEYRAILIDKGFRFTSDSDTEIIANLLSYLLQVQDAETNMANTMLGTVDINTIFDTVPSSSTIAPKHIQAIHALKKILKGSYALGIMFADRPDDIFAIRCESPLIVGLGDRELLIASDIVPLAAHANKIVYLKNHEIAHLHNNLSMVGDSRSLYHYSAEGELITSEIQTIEWNFETIDKQGYDHFMIKEIHEQPSIFARLYSKYIDDEHMPTKFPFSKKQQTILQNCSRIILISCGTSYNASLYASYLFEMYTGMPCTVEYASEFRYRSPALDKQCLVIAISQSGETADTYAALQLARQFGAYCLGIVNVATSSIAREADLVLCTEGGVEIGVASTKAFTAQLLLLYYLVMYIANLRQTLEMPVIAKKIEQSKLLPNLSEVVLSHEATIHELGRAYAGYQHMLYLGRGLMYPLALEGALKLKELSYIHAEGYAAAEMKHGPIALIDYSMPIVVFSPQHSVLYQKMQSNIAEAKVRGGRILAFISEGDTNTNFYDDSFEMPILSEDLDPILYTLPLQLFAYYAALARSYDPDKPRNLAKSVTVE